MAIKLKISKKVLTRLAVFVALTAGALLFDIYFDNHPVELEQIEAGSEKKPVAEHGVVYLFNPVNASSVKTTVQKTPTRKLFDQTHNKNLQKYHQLRNYQVLKAEANLPRKSLVLSYHHLTFRHCFFTFPDDDPFIS